MANAAIIKIYADLVRAGRRTIEDVPEDIRAAVATLLGAEQDA